MNEHCSPLKGELSPKIKVFWCITRLCSKPGRFPKRPVKVSCDVTQHLVAYRTAVGTRTNSSRMRTHTGQHSWLPCMHTLFLLDWLYEAYRNRTKTDDITVHLCCTKATLHRLLEGFSFPNLPSILGNNFSISTSTPGRLISEKL